MSETTESTAASPDAQERRPIWEMDWKLRCPITGLCLTPTEQKRILKKAHLSRAGLSPHDMHEIFGKGIETDGRLARRVQRTLDAKYRREIAECSRVAVDQWLCWWKEQLEPGKMEGALWAVASRPSVPEAVMEEVWGDVHMYPYLQSHRMQEVLRQVRQLGAENQTLS